MSLPREDVLNHQRLELIDTITMTMGGRIAEELQSGDISSGAAGDIQQATSMARAMVCQFGMSDKVGMVQYGGDNEYVFLGRDMVRSKDYSENTAKEIDTEVKKLINNAYARALKLIEDNHDKLDLIAKALLEYETLDGSQVEEIVKEGKFHPPAPPPPGAPPARIFARVVRSGATPIAPCTPPGDTRKPVTTSSNIRMTSCLFVTSRRPFRNSALIGTIPVAPPRGSRSL